MKLIVLLAAHYWRPQMPSALGDAVLRDWVMDLRPFETAAIKAACDAWRQSPNKFFPKPGELLALVRSEQAAISARRAAPKQNREFDSRPIMWWAQPVAMWKPHWREEEIPPEWQEAYRKRRERLGS